MTRLVARGLLAALVLAVFLVWMIEKAPAAAAAPPPDARRPLTWPPRTVARAASWWADLVTDPYGGDPIVWRTTRSTCARRPRPPRWRCDVVGTILYDGEPDQVVAYRLRACRPSRLVYDDVLYKSRGKWKARVAVEDSGDNGGGLICPSVSWTTTSA